MNQIQQKTQQQAPAKPEPKNEEAKFLGYTDDGMAIYRLPFEL